jgi:hypothetical protein
MRPIVSRFAPASLLLTAFLIGEVVLAAEPAPKPPDTATLGHAPAIAPAAPRATVRMLQPIAPARSATVPTPRTKPSHPAFTSRPADPAALNAQQRAKLAGLPIATAPQAITPAGKAPEQVTVLPPAPGRNARTPEELEKAKIATPPLPAAQVPPRGEKRRSIVTVGREPAVPAPAPAIEALQKQAAPATVQPRARKAAESSTTRPRDPAAPSRDKPAAPDSTKQEVRP